MTRKELIRMAQEVAILMSHDRHQDAATKLERFAELVAAAEREAVLNVLWEYAGRKDLSDDDQSLLKHLVDIIRARGEA
jgi:hypothetical protein